MQSQNDEINLLKYAAAGDAEAFSELYHRYRDRVFGFAYRMLAVQEIAEDVTHEAFLVLIEHPERYSLEKGSLHTFLCAVARNHILLHLRRNRRHPEEDLDHLDDFLDHHIETMHDPLAALLDQELAAKVDASIAALSPLQREVIILREFQELTYEEIASVTGSDVNVVKARLYRARQALGRLLASYLTTDGDRCYELR